MYPVWDCFEIPKDMFVYLDFLFFGSVSLKIDVLV